MAKTTVTRELVAEFPSLEKFLGQSVDPSVVANARREHKLAAKGKNKKDESAPASAPVAPARTPARRTSAKRTSTRSGSSKKSK